MILSAVSVVFAFEVRGILILVRSKFDIMSEWRRQQLEENGVGFALYSFFYYLLLSLLPTILQVFLIMRLFYHKRRTGYYVSRSLQKYPSIDEETMDYNSEEYYENLRDTDFVERRKNKEDSLEIDKQSLKNSAKTYVSLNPN